MNDEKDASQKYQVSPRITTNYLKSRIVETDYHHFPATRTTVCNVKLDNGYTITESVVCTNPEHYDEQQGRKNAFNKVIEELRKLEYYLLRQRLYEESMKVS